MHGWNNEEFWFDPMPVLYGKREAKTFENKNSAPFESRFVVGTLPARNLWRKVQGLPTILVLPVSRLGTYDTGMSLRCIRWPRHLGTGVGFAKGTGSSTMRYEYTSPTPITRLATRSICENVCFESCQCASTQLKKSTKTRSTNSTKRAETRRKNETPDRADEFPSS